MRNWFEDGKGYPFDDGVWIALSLLHKKSSKIMEVKFSSDFHEIMKFHPMKFYFHRCEVLYLTMGECSEE